MGNAEIITLEMQNNIRYMETVEEAYSGCMSKRLLLEDKLTLDKANQVETQYQCGFKQ